MKPFLKNVSRHILNNKYLYLIFLFFYSLRIFNLTGHPLFNDESIYLDWGYREINMPGFLYYSLYDAKQPLLMWIFGISQNIFSDPIFAGRIVSVFAGALSVLGIYKLANVLFNKKTALFSCVLYVIAPLFSFYDRQALMESAITAVGIWVCYFLIQSLKEQKYINYIFLGIVLGIGFFIKSSAIIFLATSILILITNLILFKNKKKIFEGMFVVFLVFVTVILLLIINPQFWQTLNSNSRFTYGILEILEFPIAAWMNTAVINFKISFFYITPFIFIFAVIGLVHILKDKEMHRKTFIIFYLISLIFELLLIRIPSDRYLISFLPFLLVSASYILINIYSKKNIKNIGFMFIILCTFSSFTVTAFQVYKQADYLLFMGNYSGYKYSNYLDTFTSGYGLKDVFSYINKVSKDKNIIVSFAQNTGNPESAMLVYFAKRQNIKSVYFDSRLLPPEVFNYDCINTSFPTYFISRSEEQFGLDKFLIKLKTINNPYGKNTIGIYTLKTNCKGKTTDLSLTQN